MKLLQSIESSIAKLRWWFLIPIIAALLALSAWALRQNNLKMLELRDAVVLVDQDSGDINEITPVLEELGNYVLSHMNTDLGGPLELPGTYNVAVEQARERADHAYRQPADIGLLSNLPRLCSYMTQAHRNRIHECLPVRGEPDHPVLALEELDTEV